MVPEGFNVNPRGGVIVEKIYEEEETEEESSITEDSMGSTIGENNLPLISTQQQEVESTAAGHAGCNSPSSISTTCTSMSTFTTTAIHSGNESNGGFIEQQEKKRKEEAKNVVCPPFVPQYVSTRFLQHISFRLFGTYCLSSSHSNEEEKQQQHSTWIGFWGLLGVTCANYVLTPMRDAIALAVGVDNLPKLTLASALLAVLSSVPIGWLFEAPDPNRRRLWKRMGLTRGETQGTSLALFYRCFAISLLSYAVGFRLFRHNYNNNNNDVDGENENIFFGTAKWWALSFSIILKELGQFIYIAFFLVVHLMKLHSLSLVWGVTSEAMEYEDVARKRYNMPSTKTRLQRLAFVGFGGTLGGILGSIIASTMARILKLSGLLVVAALLLEVSAELSIELGRIMQRHWEQQQQQIQRNQSSQQDLASLDTSMKRSSSMGSMKRVASGNSINRVKSLSELNKQVTVKKNTTSTPIPKQSLPNSPSSAADNNPVDDSSFTQRLLRGVTTILRSRLLMCIFTYNALYASTSVLLSFQRAALVAARNDNNNGNSSAESDTAFLANINMASSLAVFLLQASGLGAALAQLCGSRGTLALMPTIRLAGVLSLAWWHQFSNGRPPNLLLFLLVDECTRVVNMAVAKPVRESLWRGLSNEARYEAKPIVDTLANRWGAGSAAFLVSMTDKLLDIFGVDREQQQQTTTRTVFGFPPILFLCMIVAAWWTMVSADLGQIRRRIDLELKKRQ